MPGSSIKERENSSILIASRRYYARMRMRKALDAWHWDILEAEDGKEAVKIYKTSKPKLVILDNDLPVLSGFEAASQILGLEPEARIILLGDWEDQNALPKLKLPVPLLEKPVNLKELVHLSAELTRPRMR